MEQSQKNDLPLFPLLKPVFPCIPQQLRIFEQRYLGMVSEVLKADGAFGIVPITKGGEAGQAADFYPYGTLVTIHDWQQLPDGLLGLAVMGVQRIHVERSSVDKQQLIRGAITVFTEDMASMPDEAHADLLDLAEALTDHPLSRRLAAENPLSLFQLTWLLAELLPLGREAEFELLACNGNEARLNCIRAATAQLVG